MWRRWDVWRPGSRAADPAPPWSASPSPRTPLCFRSVPIPETNVHNYPEQAILLAQQNIVLCTAEGQIHGCSNIGLVQVRPAVVEVARCAGACTARQHLKHRYFNTLKLFLV